MKGSPWNRSQFIVGVALSIVGIALAGAAILMVLLTDYPTAARP